MTKLWQKQFWLFYCDTVYSRISSTRSLGVLVTALSTADVTFKCLPMRNPPGERYARIWYVFLLLKHRQPNKSLPIIRSPPEKSHPADDLPVKSVPPGGFLPVNCRPWKTFLGGRRSYNGTPAHAFNLYILTRPNEYRYIDIECRELSIGNCRLSFPPSVAFWSGENCGQMSSPLNFGLSESFRKIFCRQKIFCSIRPNLRLKNVHLGEIVEAKSKFWAPCMNFGVFVEKFQFSACLLFEPRTPLPVMQPDMLHRHYYYWYVAVFLWCRSCNQVSHYHSLSGWCLYKGAAR